MRPVLRMCWAYSEVLAPCSSLLASAAALLSSPFLLVNAILFIIFSCATHLILSSFAYNAPPHKIVFIFWLLLFDSNTLGVRNNISTHTFLRVTMHNITQIVLFDSKDSACGGGIRYEHFLKQHIVFTHQQISKTIRDGVRNN